MENVKKEIEWALKYIQDKDLLVCYLLCIASKQYTEGKMYVIDNYDIKLKQNGK